MLAAGVLTGCEDEQVRSYQAPKAAPYVPPAPMGPAADPQASGPGVTWDVPEGWQPATGGSGMAMASFDVPGIAGGSDESGGSGGSGPARVTVTPLSGQAGGVLANINRWRGQVGLGPIEKIEDQPMTGVHVDHAAAGLIDLTAPEGVSARTERMLVVLVPRQQQNQTWFFKMTGPNDTVTQHKEGFIGFVESVTFGGTGETGISAEGTPGE